MPTLHTKPAKKQRRDVSAASGTLDVTMKKRTFCLLFIMLLLLAAVGFAACGKDGGGSDTTESSVEETVDLGDLVGTECRMDAGQLGCTPFSAEPADGSVAVAKVADRELIITAVGVGNTALTIRNTYGEEFVLNVSCTVADGVTVSGSYTPDEGSVNVKDVMASGVKDATKAIQQAIDSLPGGGTVYIPRGVYVISHIELKKGVKLKLEGLLRDYTKDYVSSGAQGALTRGDLAVLRTDGSTDMFQNHPQHTYGRDGSSDFSVTGGMLDMKGKVRCFVWCCAENVLLKNVILKDCPNNHAIQVTGSRNVRITDCMFAGYNYKTNNTTAEIVQIEQTHPGAIGGGDNPVSKFDAGEFYFSADVEISGCYFGKSDIYDAPTYAIGHHGQSYKSAVTGLKITGCVFDNCRCSAIRYPAFSNVEISGNKFISNRANSVSTEKTPSQIHMILKNSDSTVKVKNASGTEVTAYYAKKDACEGSINTVIENNEFVFGGNTKMRMAVNAVSNSLLNDAEYDSNAYYVSWYKETAKLYRGYRLVKNRIENLTVRGNSITVDDKFAGDGFFFEFRFVDGLLCENNTVTGREYTSKGSLGGVKVDYARISGCTPMADYGHKYTIPVTKTYLSGVVLGGEGGMTLRCTDSSLRQIKLVAEGGRLDISVGADGSLTVTPVAENGKTFAGYRVVSGTLTDNSGKKEFSGDLTVSADFK